MQPQRGVQSQPHRGWLNAHAALAGSAGSFHPIKLYASSASSRDPTFPEIKGNSLIRSSFCQQSEWILPSSKRFVGPAIRACKLANRQRIQTKLRAIFLLSIHPLHVLDPEDEPPPSVGLLPSAETLFPTTISRTSRMTPALKSRAPMALPYQQPMSLK